VSEVPPGDDTRVGPSDPSVPSDPAAAEDPLAADKRTMVIGGTAMVVLILVGVISAQLFARGGCAAVADPRPVTGAAGEVTPAELVGEVLGIDGEAAIGAIERTAGVPVTTAAAVGDAEHLLPIEDGLIAAGPTVTSFDAALTPVSTFETSDRLVGGGPTVYDVAVANEATGQADALVSLSGPALDVGTCVDTAVVGSPFAFLLGAGDGQLLLLRADEDGDRPELQLRDDESGALWDTRIVLPAGPPGALAERTSAGLGPDTVVAARRVGPQEETTSPAVIAHDREDGTERFALDAATLARTSELDGAAPIRWEVAAVGATTALLHGRPDPSDAADDAPVATDGVLVLLDLAAGDVTTTVAGVGPLVATALDPAAPDDRYAVATATRDREDELRLIDADGRTDPLVTALSDTHLAWLGDTALAAGDDRLVRIDPAGDADDEVVDGARIDDLVATADGRVAVLLTAEAEGDEAGGDAVLVVTTRSGDLEPAPTTSADD
jgi:hypothetical protein